MSWLGLAFGERRRRQHWTYTNLVTSFLGTTRNRIIRDNLPGRWYWHGPVHSSTGSHLLCLDTSLRILLDSSWEKQIQSREWWMIITCVRIGLSSDPYRDIRIRRWIYRVDWEFCDRGRKKSSCSKDLRNLCRCPTKTCTIEVSLLILPLVLLPDLYSSAPLFLRTEQVSVRHSFHSLKFFFYLFYESLFLRLEDQ